MSVSPRPEKHCRGIAPVVGVVTLIAITVALAAIVAVAAGTLSIGSAGPTTAAFELSVDGDRSEITLEHTAGDAVDVETLTVTVEVNGDPLEEQPPVPFVGASGFYGTPGGPFNAETESEWHAGERASVRLATTNEPTIESGDTVTVTLASEQGTLITLETKAT